MVKEIEKIMRTRNIYILSAYLVAVLSCTEFQEENIQMNETETVEMTFTATICDETDSETRTVLDGQLGDDFRKVLWTPEDEIAVFINGGEKISPWKFVNTAEENSETATFKGGAPVAQNYFAVYPYDQSVISWYYPDDATGTHYSILFEIPHEQKYIKGSFADNTAPMIAKAAYGEPLQFKNLCGILALNLTGNETVSSITFSGKDEAGNFKYVSGDFQINMDYVEEPVIVPGPEGPTGQALLETTYKSVRLECDEPVQLSETEATPFYFILPPSTYERFYIVIETSDGIMMKEGTKPLTIKRSDVQPTADLAYVETVSINLSENGVANCYIVPQAGVYSFRADVIGNGDFGIIEGADFHTDNTSITPDDADLLWCSTDGALESVSYNESRGEISFISTGLEGNAVIAAFDEDDKILWSWHIWMTDQPAELRYQNYTGDYIVFDRNLGATHSLPSTDTKEWEQTRGLAYQWGRKDPFVDAVNDEFNQSANIKPGAYRTNTNQVSIETTIENPQVFYGEGHSMWMSSTNASLWSSTQKTIYDPCPPGFMVASSDVWRGFTKNGENVNGEFNKYNIEYVDRNGWGFLFDGVNSTYYPRTWQIGINGMIDWDNNHVTLWSSENYNSTSSMTFRTYYYSESDSHVLPSDHREDITSGHMVRCVKENITQKIYMKVTGVENITSTSAKVKGRVVSYGNDEIKQTGFIYGTDPAANHINGGIVKSTGSRSGNIEIQLNDLSQNTKYYIKSFITTVDDRTLYSDAVSFTTTGENGLVNLSYDASANCYIVPPENMTYTIDLVKGNSDESVGNAVSAVILWETTNKDNTFASNSIIEYAEIDGNTLKFTVAENAYEGNALIAAKDAGGNILWSWHIWIVKLDPAVTYNTYISGAVMMDRNLGATSVTSKVNNGDYSAFGLYYQWGRKDPFTYLGTVVPNEAIKTYSYSETANSIEYATQHPTEVYSGITWDEDYTLWSSTKTIYDPCPAGWKVPDTDVWDGWEDGNFKAYDRFKKIEMIYSTPSTYYPHPDRVEGLGIWPSAFNDNGYWWTNERCKSFSTHSGHVNFTMSDGWPSVDVRVTIRCQKDE